MEEMKQGLKCAAVLMGPVGKKHINNSLQRLHLGIYYMDCWKNPVLFMLVSYKLKNKMSV